MKEGVYVYIKCDTNDGDYTAKMSLVQAEDADLLEKLGVELRKKGPKYGTSFAFNAMWEEFSSGPRYDEQFPMFTDYEFEILFENYFPTSEYGFHSIVEFKVFGVIGGNNLLVEEDE